YCTVSSASKILMMCFYNTDHISYDGLSVSELIEKANADLGKKPGDPVVLFGDIAVPTGLQNADPCTRGDCLWKKGSDGKVKVPYTISTQYSSQQKDTIIQAMQSLASSTCIQFIPAQSSDRNYLEIQSDRGCYSMLGRQRSSQVLSLDIRGCVVDKHVRIMFQNIDRSGFNQFMKVQTNNLRTPYDYNSIMHYQKNFFSKNGKPTIVPVPNPNVPIGMATRMSRNDIARVNRLYKCSTYIYYLLLFIYFTTE
uniref:Peptidase M12A domain-containing protein n=1 Tax=Cynoglossus semilaevis TaxID=244447 RepID=A0A3P8W2R1_CYNSE